MRQNHRILIIILFCLAVITFTVFWEYPRHRGPVNHSTAVQTEETGKTSKPVFQILDPRDHPHFELKHRKPNVTQLLHASDAGIESPFPESSAASAIVSDQTYLLNPRALVVDWQNAFQEKRWDLAMALRNRILEAGPSIAPLLFGALHSGNSALECDAIRILRQIGGPKATAMALGRVMSISSDHKDYVRYLATMRDFDSRAAADWLVRELGRTKQQSTRETLLNMLAGMDGNQAVAAIEHGLRHALDPLHQRDLITGLLMRGNPASVDALTYMMNQNAYRLPREAAARALAKIGTREALNNLAEAAEYDDHDRLDLALQFADSAYAQEALLELVLDGFWSEPVRVSAANGLASHSGYRVSVMLANALPSEREPEIASAMKDALEQSRNASTEVGAPRKTGGNASRGELWF